MCRIMKWFSILKEGVKAHFFMLDTSQWHLSASKGCFIFLCTKCLYLQQLSKPLGADNCVALRYDKGKNRTQSLLEANPITLFVVSLDQIYDICCILATHVTTPKMLFMKKALLTSLNRIYYWWYFGCTLLITILN